MKKLITLLLFIILALIKLQAQSCFTPGWSGNGYDQMNFYVTKATVNGTNMQIGDEIGIFDGSTCVGIGVLTQQLTGGTVYLAVKAIQDDPTTGGKDGFTAGNIASFKLCINGSTVVTSVSANYTSGSGVLNAGLLSVVELTGTAEVPTAPTVGTRTQPTCSVATGSVVLGGLPSSGSWTLTRSPGGVTTGGSGTSITISGLATGTYTYTVTNSAGFTSPSSSDVVIDAQPVIPAQPGTISGTTPACQASSQTYSISSVPGATSYTWTLPSGWSGTSTTTSITATVGASGGTISVTANNACGSSTSRTLSVTVTALPGQPGTITGATAVCQGAAQTYSISAVTGATSYTWTLPSGWSGSSTTTSISATPGATGGTISVTANNTCGSGTARTLTVTVTALPAQPGTITGATTVCQGAAQTYSISAVTGATSYTWTLPSGWSGTSTTTSISATPGATGGTISVTANNTCGPGTARTLSVTVTTVPGQPGTISGNTAPCQGINLTYSIASVSGATSYTWTLPSGWSGTSTTESITATPGTTGGTISVTANNTCGSGTARTLSVSVTLLPAQPGPITGNTSVCQGIDQTYSISAVSGATSYTWILPSGWSGSSSSTSITTTPGAAGGTIRVTANSNTCGSGPERSLSVTVTPLPAQPGTITGATTVCQGAAQTYSISAVTGATSYTWTLPSGWSGSSTTTSISATPGATGGTISVTANNTCGSGTARTLSVTVTTLPGQPGAIAGGTTVCQGLSQTYSISSVSGATSYTWTVPSGWSGSSTTTSINTTPGATGGTISVTANNACGSGTAQTLSVTVTALPAQPGSITGSTTVCQAAAQTYSISAVSGATSYTWTLPSGWSGSSTTTSISATPGATGGTISVAANNGCGSGTARTLGVTVTTVPAQPGTITGATTVCQSIAQTYSISAVTGATSYTWSLPGGWSGSSITTSISATPGATGGTISVTANNTCGSGTARTLVVTTTTLPGQPGSIAGGTTVCQGLSQTYSISSVSGATSYTWTVPSGWSGSSTTTSINTTPGATGGTISVTANNTCGSGTAQTLSVTVTALPGQPGAITGSTTVCQAAAQTYSISAVSGATSYTWTLPSGWSGSSTTTSISATPGATGGTISVAANNGCGSGTAQTLSVTVTAIPGQPGTITGSTTVCQSIAQTYSISAVTGATSYTWTLPSGWSGSSTTTTISATPGAAGGTISVVANNSCGTGTSRTLVVSVAVAPAQPGTITGTTSVCQGSSQTYSISAVSGATSYTWSLPSGWSGSSTTVSITTTPGATGGTISVTANNSCGTSTARTLDVSVTAFPGQPGTISGSTSVCQGSSQSYSISSVSGATSYTWILPSGWSGSSTSTSINATAGASGGTISVTANNSCGSGTSRTLSVTVSATPAQPGSISGETTVCAGSSLTYSISSVSGATSYTWSLPSGWSGSSSSASISVTAGNNSGNISVTANNTCGSSSPRTLYITLASTPTVTTASVSGSTATTATGGGNVTSNGGINLSERGVCWSTSANPTISDSKTSDGASTGSYTSTLTGLTNGVIYHVRAFATNCAGTVYGSDFTYTHNATGIEVIQIDEISVFPNPVSGELNIEYKNDSFKTLNILNSSGKLIGKEIAVKPLQQVDFSGFEPGLYILEFVKTSGDIKRIKVIKNK